MTTVVPAFPVKGEMDSLVVEEDLEGLLDEGLTALLATAQQQGLLEPPYGRPDPHQLYSLFPSDNKEDPLVDVACDNEEEEDDDDEDDESSEEAEPVFTAPPFKFDYGFNAMTFLGKYLHKHHPRNIARRLAERKANFQYLCKRAEHGKRQINTASQLRDELDKLQTGILVGPLAGSVTTNSAVLWARTIKPGKLRFEYSDDVDLAAPDVVSVEVNYDNGLTGKVTLKDLDAGRQYYYRTYLVNPSLGFLGGASKKFLKGRFKTLPELPMPDYALRFSFASQEYAQGFDHHHAIPTTLKGQLDDQSMDFLLLLGPTLPKAEPHPTTNPISPNQTNDSSHDSNNQASGPPVSNALADLRQGYRKSLYYSRVYESLHEVALQIAWNDNSEGAVEALLQEEVQVAKEAAKDAKQTDKTTTTAGTSHTSTSRGPNLTPKKTARTSRDKKDEASKTLTAAALIPLRPSYQAFTDFFPARCGEGPSRGHSYWKCSVCGDLVEMYYLDTRGGIVGARQAKWLIESIQSSKATWKIIASGSSVGYLCRNATPTIPTAANNTARSEAGEGETVRGRSTSRGATPTSRKSQAMPATDRSGTSEGKSTSRSLAHKRSSRSLTPSDSQSNSHTATRTSREDKVLSLARVVQKLQGVSATNVLLLSGAVPFPYIVTLGNEAASGENRQKLTYYEFGACSLVQFDGHQEDKAEVQQLYRLEDSLLPVKEVVPIMVGSYYGVLTVSKSGKIKYSIHSSRDGSKRQWLEVKPIKA